MSTIIVTGAGRGIGHGIATELARRGHQVAIHYNANRDAAIATAGECAELRAALPGAPGADPRTADPERDVFQADLSRPDDRTRLVDEIFSRYGTVDGLVNNAGMAPRQRDDLLTTTRESFAEVLQTNLHGPFFLTQEIARRWIDSPADTSRRVVFITSVSAEMASVERGEYCISKAALSMTARLFAARLAADNVLVFEVRPGIIATDMTSGAKRKYDQLIADGLVPQRRWGEPTDIGQTVAAICDGSLDFCTGSVINADGGLTLPRL